MTLDVTGCVESLNTLYLTSTYFKLTAMTKLCHMYTETCTCMQKPCPHTFHAGQIDPFSTVSYAAHSSGICFEIHVPRQ